MSTPFTVQNPSMSATLAIKGAGVSLPDFIDKNLLPECLSRKKSKKRPTLMRFAAYARDGKRHVGMVEGARILPAAPLSGEPRGLRQIIDGGVF